MNTVTLQLDILQLNHLKNCAMTAVVEAENDYNVYGGEHNLRMLNRAKEVYDQVDEAFNKACREMDETYTQARKAMPTVVVSNIPF